MTYSEIDPDVQRVRYEVRRFRQHFITYVAVIGVLFIVNALTGGFWFGHWWFFWIALIWGVILALEAGPSVWGRHRPGVGRPDGRSGGCPPASPGCR
jgi:hypothetical protein